MKQKNSVLIYCFIYCATPNLSYLKANSLQALKDAQQRAKEQKIRDILGPDADLERFTTPLQAQLEKIRREKEQAQKAKEQKATPPAPQEASLAPTPPAPQELSAPEPLPAAEPPAAAPKPTIKPKPRPSSQKPAQKPEKLSAPPKPEAAKPNKPLKPPVEAAQKPQQTVSAQVLDLEITEKEERKLSLKLFSLLIPVLASYNEERLFGQVLEKDSLTNQKHAAKTIATFIQKLTEKLQKINDDKLYEYLRSKSFKAQSWSLELFARLNAVFGFCKKQLRSYQANKEQSESIKELQKQFEEKIALLNQLSKQYFNYNPSEK